MAAGWETPPPPPSHRRLFVRRVQTGEQTGLESLRVNGGTASEPAGTLRPKVIHIPDDVSDDRSMKRPETFTIKKKRLLMKNVNGTFSGMVEN